MDPNRFLADPKSLDDEPIDPKRLLIEQYERDLRKSKTPFCRPLRWVTRDKLVRITYPTGTVLLEPGDEDYNEAEVEREWKSLYG